MGDAGGAYILQAGENTERGIDKTYFHTFTRTCGTTTLSGAEGLMFPRDPDKMFIPEGTTKEIVDKQKEVFAGRIPEL